MYELQMKIGSKWVLIKRYKSMKIANKKLEELRKSNSVDTTMVFRLLVNI